MDVTIGFRLCESKQNLESLKFPQLVLAKGFKSQQETPLFIKQCYEKSEDLC